ncbi:MAG: DUF4345 domain-containing protein [Actinomycetota bacterium]|nr:DUF4345 domain-containing protein [Actinomycetota bacterium]
MERALRVVLVVLGVFVIVTGALDIVIGTATLPGNTDVPTNVDSNYRFFAAIWLMLGLVLLWIVPRVREATAPLRVVCAAVFVGGLARVMSLIVAGVPDPLLVAFIGVELIVPPVLLVWQASVRKSTSR